MPRASCRASSTRAGRPSRLAATTARCTSAAMRRTGSRCVRAIVRACRKWAVAVGSSCSRASCPSSRSALHSTSGRVARRAASSARWAKRAAVRSRSGASRLSSTCTAATSTTAAWASAGWPASSERAMSRCHRASAGQPIRVAMSLSRACSPARRRAGTPCSPPPPPRESRTAAGSGNRSNRAAQATASSSCSSTVACSSGAVPGSTRQWARDSSATARSTVPSRIDRCAASQYRRMASRVSSACSYSWAACAHQAPGSPGWRSVSARAARRA